MREELRGARVHVSRHATERSVASSTWRTRREELVDAAARLFAERGYHGTSMADLAEAMGVQKGSLYSLTESKQELLVTVTRDGAASFHAGARPACRTTRAARADPASRSAAI